MEVHLSDEAAAIVQRCVAEGWYANANEAVEAAVAMLGGADADAAWLTEYGPSVKRALDELDRGESVEGTPEFYEELRERVRRRANASR